MTPARSAALVGAPVSCAMARPPVPVPIVSHLAAPELEQGQRHGDRTKRGKGHREHRRDHPMEMAEVQRVAREIA